MRTWLLLGCLIAGIAHCIRAPLPAARSRPLRNAPPQESARCAIEGRTFHSITGQPVANVRILLHDTNPKRARRSAAVADAVGHFRFPNLEPGVYRLDAQQLGFPPLLYDSNSASAKAGTITLSAGQRVKNLEIRLTPAASITGTVVDRRNRIIAHASVGIEATRNEGGVRRVVRADARGRFRIGLLPPGRYRITAEPDAESAPPWSARNHEWDPSGRIVTVRNRSAEAPAVVVVVEVEAGEELSDVQVVLPASRGMPRFALT